MRQKFLAASLILAQILTPAYAFSGDQFYYRYTKALVSSSTNNNGGTGNNGGSDSGTPGSGTGGGGNSGSGNTGGGVTNPSDPTTPADKLSGPIPGLTLAALQGYINGAAITSQAPSSPLATIDDYLNGGASAVVFDDAQPAIAGLVFDKTTGRISGVATASFDGTVSISYHDTQNRPGVLQLPVTLHAIPVLTSSKDIYQLPVGADSSFYGIKVYPANDGFYAGVSYALAPGSDALPAGLVLSSSGVVSGSTIASIGTVANIVVRGTSLVSSSVFADRAFSIKVTDPHTMALNLQPSNALVWTLDAANQKVVAQDDFDPMPLPTGAYTAPLTWSLSSNPAWMTIDSYGQLGGTPPKAGDYKTTVAVKDASGQTASDTAAIHVTLSDYIAMTPVADFSTRAGETFVTTKPTVANYVGNYRFTINSIPPSVAFSNATGVMNGEFGAANTYSWKLHLTDSDGRTENPATVYATKLTVFGRLSQKPATSAVGGAVGSPLLAVQWPSTTNLMGKASYAIVGDLPGTLYYKVYDNDDSTALATYVSGNSSAQSIRQNSGETSAQTEARLASDHLVFDTLSLRLAGTPSKAGTFNVALYVSDDHQATGYKVLNDSTKLAYNTATSTSTAFTVVNTGFFALNQQLSNQVIAQYTGSPDNGTGIFDKASNDYYGKTLTWTLASGTLPPGITTTFIHGGADLRYGGYPSATGSWANITWTVTDSDNISITTDPVSFTVNARDPFKLTPSVASVSSTAGDSVALTVTASGIAYGVLPNANWTVSGLPNGLNATPSGKLLSISGKPTTAGTFNIVVSASDSESGADTVTIPVTVTSGLIAVNTGGSAINLAQYTSQASNGTAIRVTASNDAYTGHLTWSLASGTLPPGIKATVASDTDSMGYTGYATTQGTWANIAWNVTNDTGTTITTPPVSFTVGASADLKLTSDRGATYTSKLGSGSGLTITASNVVNGIAILQSDWTVTGTLPDGMSVSYGANSLIIAGTPTVPGTFSNIAVSARDSAGRTATITVAVSIYNDLSFSYPNGASETIAATTGKSSLSIGTLKTGGYSYHGGGSYSLVSGSLPPGMGFTSAADGSGLSFTGYPTTAGTYDNVLFQFTDPFGGVFPVNALTFTVGPRANMTLAVTPSTSYNLTFGDTLAATVFASNMANGTQPTWSVSGTLPDNISFAANTTGLVFSGKPTSVGTYNDIVVTATDAMGQPATATLSITVTSGLTASTPSGTSETLYQYTSTPSLIVNIKNADGTAWVGGGTATVTSGTLPPNVSVVTGANGSSISFAGYPTATGTFNNIVVSLKDTNGGLLYQTAPMSFTVAARKALTLTASPTTSPVLSVNVDSANTTITASNLAYGTAIANTDWSVTGLPPGVTPTANSTGYALTGKPTTAGNYNATVTAKDAAGTSQSLVIAFTVTGSGSHIYWRIADNKTTGNATWDGSGSHIGGTETVSAPMGWGDIASSVWTDPALGDVSSFRIIGTNTAYHFNTQDRIWAFSGNIDNYQIKKDTALTGTWWRSYKFSKAVNITSVAITYDGTWNSQNSAIMNPMMQYSDDGSTWVTAWQTTGPRGTNLNITFAKP